MGWVCKWIWRFFRFSTQYRIFRPFVGGGYVFWKPTLTLILLTWTIWRAPTNASKWRIGFNSAFKGLIVNSGWSNLKHQIKCEIRGGKRQVKYCGYFEFPGGRAVQHFCPRDRVTSEHCPNYLRSFYLNANKYFVTRIYWTSALITKQLHPVFEGIGRRHKQ